MKASARQLATTNEELQSTNEELETMIEELRSIAYRFDSRDAASGRRGQLDAQEFDYYRWCPTGCGLYCFNRTKRTWIKLA